MWTIELYIPPQSKQSLYGPSLKSLYFHRFKSTTITGAKRKARTFQLEYGLGFLSASLTHARRKKVWIRGIGDARWKEFPRR